MVKAAALSDVMGDLQGLALWLRKWKVTRECSLPPQQPQQATESTQEYHFSASKRAEIVNENLASLRRNIPPQEKKLKVIKQ